MRGGKKKGKETCFRAGAKKKENLGLGGKGTQVGEGEEDHL